MADDAVFRIIVEDEAVLKEPAVPPKDKDSKRAEESGSITKGKKLKEGEGLDTRTIWQKLGQDLIEGATDVIFSNVTGALGPRFARTVSPYLVDSIIGGKAKNQEDGTPPAQATNSTATAPVRGTVPATPTTPAQPTQTPKAAPTATGPAPVVPTATAAEAATASTAAPVTTGAVVGAVAGGAAAGPPGAMVGAALAVIAGDKLMQAVVQLAQYLHRTVQEMIGNSKNFSPEVAQQAAASELRKINMELRRAQQIGPTLARWERTLSVISTMMEDFKTQLVAITDTTAQSTAARVAMAASTSGISELLITFYQRYDKWLSEQQDQAMIDGMEFLNKPLTDEMIGNQFVRERPVPNGIF